MDVARRGDSSARNLLARIAEEDPDLARAAREVDRELLRWMLGLSLDERLRASANAARALGRFRRVSP